MELDGLMFDEAFDIQGNEIDGQKYPYINPPQDERWPPLGAASTEESITSFRENGQRYDEILIVYFEGPMSQIAKLFMI